MSMPIRAAALQELWAFPIEIRCIHQIPFTVSPDHRKGKQYYELCNTCLTASDRVQRLMDGIITTLNDEISDDLSKKLILDKYTHNLTGAELSEKYCYSERHINRIIQRGLDELKHKGLFESGEA